MRPIWILLILGFIAGPAAAQDKAKLEVRAKRGDKVAVFDSSTNTGQFKMTFGEQEQTMDTLEKTWFEYNDEVLEVDANGWPSKVKRKVTKWREKEKKAGQEKAQEKTMFLEGKTFTLVKDGENTKLEGVEGVPTKEAKKNHLRSTVFVAALPKGEVPVGTTWDLPEADLKKEFQEDMADDGSNIKITSAKGKGKFASLSGGVASIVYDVAFKGEMQDGLALVFSLKVTAKLDVAKKRLVSLLPAGDVQLSGTIDQEGEKVPISGSFKITGEVKHFYGTIGGGGPKQFVIPTMSPFMYAKDFSKYKVGAWVEYDMGMMSIRITCVGKDGANTWIQVGMRMKGYAYEHLLLVDADAKVTKAWFSGKGFDAWAACKINQMPVSGKKAPKDCPACGKAFDDHKKPDVKGSDDTVKVGKKEVGSKKLDLTYYKCDGRVSFQGTYWFSADIPDLYQMHHPILKSIGKVGVGSLVKMGMSSYSITCVGFGTDGKPKHDLPQK